MHSLDDDEQFLDGATQPGEFRYNIDPPVSVTDGSAYG